MVFQFLFWGCLFLVKLEGRDFWIQFNSVSSNTSWTLGRRRCSVVLTSVASGVRLQDRPESRCHYFLVLWLWVSGLTFSDYFFHLFIKGDKMLSSVLRLSRWGRYQNRKTFHCGWKLPKTWKILRCCRSRRSSQKLCLAHVDWIPYIKQVSKVVLELQILEPSYLMEVMVYDSYPCKFRARCMLQSVAAWHRQQQERGMLKLEDAVKALELGPWMKWGQFVTSSPVIRFKEETVSLQRDTAGMDEVRLNFRPSRARKNQLMFGSLPLSLSPDVAFPARFAN